MSMFIKLKEYFNHLLLEKKNGKVEQIFNPELKKRGKGWE